MWASEDGAASRSAGGGCEAFVARGTGVAINTILCTIRESVDRFPGGFTRNTFKGDMHEETKYLTVHTGAVSQSEAMEINTSAPNAGKLY